MCVCVCVHGHCRLQSLYSLAQFPNNIIVVCPAGEVMVARVH